MGNEGRALATPIWESFRCDGFHGPFAEHVADVLEIVRESIQYQRDLIVLTPSSLSVTLLGAFVAGLTMVDMRLSALTDDPRSALDNLEVGDVILYRGLRGAFMGVESIAGLDHPKIKIRYRDYLNQWIDLHHVWEISKCGDDVTRTDKYDPPRDPPILTERSVLAHVLGRSERRMPPHLGVQVVVVTQKQNAVRHFATLKCGDVPFTSILPTAYFMNPSSFERIGKDSLRRDPVLRFFSAFDQAIEANLVSRDDAAFFIHGFDQLRGNIIRVEELRRRKSPLVILDEVHKLDVNDERLLQQLSSMGFSVVLAPSPERSVSAASTAPTTQQTTSELSLSPRRVLFAAGYEAKAHVVETDVAYTLEELRELLLGFTRRRTKTEELRQLLAGTWSLVNALTRVPLSIDDLQSIGLEDEYKARMNRLHSLLPWLYRSIGQEDFDQIQQILTKLDECVTLHQSGHPKQGMFLDQLERFGAQGCVLVGTSFERNVLAKWVRALELDVSVLSVNDLKRSTQLFVNSLATGWFGSLERVGYSGLVESNQLIFYPFEEAVYRDRAAAFEARLQRLSQEDSMGTSQSSVRDAAALESFDSSDADLPDDVLDIFQHESAVRFGDEKPAGVEALPVIFEEDAMAFLTRNHRCQCLDLDSESVFRKRPSELQPGDILVFVKDSSADIFDELMSILWEEPEFHATVAMSQLWKDALERYVRHGNLSIADLQEQLRRVGVERSTATIRRWMSPGSIGPEDDAIRAIARLTQDTQLNSKVEEVINACRRMRILHRAVGRYLARSIVSSMTDSVTASEAMWFDAFGNNLSRHAELVTVRKVEHESVVVAPSKANRLHRRNMVREIGV